MDPRSPSGLTGSPCPVCGGALAVEVRAALDALPASLSIATALPAAPATRQRATVPAEDCPACVPVTAPSPRDLDPSSACDLLGNPFHLLGASPIDRGVLLVARAAWRERQIGSSATRALSILLDPSARLLAEVGWLPRTRPSRAAQVIRLILTDPASDLPLHGLSPLALANAVATQLVAGLSRLRPERARARVEALGEAAAAIDPDVVRGDVLADRTASGFPEVEGEAIAAALARLRRFHLRAAMTALLG